MQSSISLHASWPMVINLEYYCAGKFHSCGFMSATEALALTVVIRPLNPKPSTLNPKPLELMTTPTTPKSTPRPPRVECGVSDRKRAGRVHHSGFVVQGLVGYGGLRWVAVGCGGLRWVTVGSLLRGCDWIATQSGGMFYF